MFLCISLFFFSYVYKYVSEISFYCLYRDLKEENGDLFDIDKFIEITKSRFLQKAEKELSKEKILRQEFNNKESIHVRKYQLSIKEQIENIVKNYEYDESIISYLELMKFRAIDEFANRLVFMYDTNDDKNQNFMFTLDIDGETIKYVRKYLIKHKKFIFNYIVSRKSFDISYLYQLYLQYVPYNLTDVEKNIFLDGYIKMLSNLCEAEIVLEKRKKFRYS